ncbi:HAD hydrolase-like protein [Streptomyces sp. NBC_00414]|uniref:HAD family hydrolase n=1 Tax=Streptomyces sp. NBC_00414 TaxID=2975739 RepID=UPI002E23A2C2
MFFDFDGPVCDLFGGTPTAHIAEEIKVMARLEWGALDRAVEDCHDSHGILLRLRDVLDGAPEHHGREPLAQADAIVTRYEYAAVGSAVQCSDVGPLLDALRDLGKRLAIVSNNAEGPVLRYLERTNLTSKFEVVCGRDPYEPRHMKPHPDPVRRALAAVGVPATGRALLVGDQLSDLAAARAAGVRFLGHTQDERLRRRMKQTDADGVVASHASVLAAARTLVGDVGRHTP